MTADTEHREDCRSEQLTKPQRQTALAYVDLGAPCSFGVDRELSLFSALG
jgi:hypothetical protein